MTSQRPKASPRRRPSYARAVAVALALPLLSSVPYGTTASAMNKGELIDAMAKEAGLSKADAGRALNAFTAEAGAAVKKGGGLALSGLGVLSSCDEVACFYPDASLTTRLYSRYVTDFWLEAVAVAVAESGPRPRDAATPPFEASSLRGGSDLLLDLAGVLEKLPPEGAFAVRPEDRAAHRDLLAHELAHVVQQRGGVGQLLTTAPESLWFFAECSIAGGDLDGDGTADGTDIAVSKDFASGAGAEACEAQDYNSSRSNKANSLSYDRLVKRVGSRAKLTPSQAAAAMGAMTGAVATALQSGARVSIEGFGSFGEPQHRVHTGRNPQTGKEIRIAARKAVKFKAGAELSGSVSK